MKRLNGKELKALLVLSIVVPVGLLATLRLTGVLEEPANLETFTIEAAEWNIDRPSMTVEFKDAVENSYSNENVSVTFEVFLDQYLESVSTYGGSDFINMGVSVTANVTEGFVESIYIAFNEKYKHSEVWLPNPDLTRRGYFYLLENLSIEDWAAAGWFERKLKNNTKAFIKAVGVHQPNNIFFRAGRSHWVLRSESNQSHQMEVTLELVYRTKHAYEKIILPIILEMTPDIGNTYATARNVTAGEHRGCIDHVDYVDMYTVTLQEGQMINITLTPPKTANYDLYLYNPNYDMVANSTQTENKPEFISHTIDETGTWYLKISNKDWPSPMSGIYTLEIEVKGP